MNQNNSRKSLRGRIKQFILRSKYPSLSTYLKEFKKTDTYDKQQIEEYQLCKLRALLDFAYEHVPYYHRVFDEIGLKPEDIHSTLELSKLPILTKEIIWKEGKNMHADVALNDVKAGSTSGSTGKSLVFLKNAEAREIERALMTRYRRNGGVDESQFAINIWGSHSFSTKERLKREFVSWLLNEKNYNSYDLSEDNVAQIIKKLQSGKVHYLRGYTSAVFYVAQVMNKQQIQVEVPFISVTAEQLYDFQRAEIEKAMGPNIFNQYGCGECGALAMECSAHEGLHHAFEHSILEVLDDENNPTKHGRVILTNLDNYAMPLIRYENGDIVTLAEKGCSCRRHSQLIAHIDGRKYDILEGEPGHFAHGGFFDDCILKVDLMNKYNIRQMRIVQKEQTMFCLQYVAEKEIESVDQQILTDDYRLMLGKSVQLLFERRDEIQSAASGKRHFVIPLNTYLKNPEIYK